MELEGAAGKAGLKADDIFDGKDGRGGNEGCDELLDTPGGPGYDMMNFDALSDKWVV